MKSQCDRNNVWGRAEGGGGYFLKTPFLLRFLAYLANSVPLILNLPCDDKKTEFFDGMAMSFSFVDDPNYRTRATVSFE